MCNMNAAETVLTITVAEAQPGDVILNGPYGPERTVMGAFRPNWTDFEEPVRSLSHMETSKPEVRHADGGITFGLVGGEIDHWYGLYDEITVRRAVSAS